MAGKRGKAISKNQDDGIINVEALSFDDEFLECAKKHISVWREYPFKFCSEYIGLELKPFQCVLLYEMAHNTNFCFIASRGIGKTFLTAIYCIWRCILYPKSEIVIAAGVKNQAYQVISKIKDIYNDSVMLREEIIEISEGQNNQGITFKNGSKILTVASNDNARSLRCNVLVMDEFRLISKPVADQVLRKFKSSPRHPKYLDLPQYKHLLESNTEILLTSAWLKSHWAYARYRSFFKQMMAGKRYFCCNISYHIGVKSGIKLKQDILDEMTEDDFDPVMWDVEMNGKFLGSSEDGLFSTDDIEVCRKISKPLYPPDIIDICNATSKNKDEKYFTYEKKKYDIMIVFADIALMSSKKHNNDASCFGIMGCVENASKTNYIREIPYIETFTGAHSETQALRIRELYEYCKKFVDEKDIYIIMDTSGVGLPIYDIIVGNILTNPITGEEYAPLGCFNDTDMHERAMYPNARKAIYSYKGNADSNSEMAIYLQNAINSKNIRFLIDENTAMSEKISRLKGYEDYSNDTKSKLKHPYMQTTFAIQEMVNLECTRTESGKIKVKESSTSRKDRYSAIAMGNYLANYFARERLKGSSTYDPDEDIEEWYVNLY